MSKHHRITRTLLGGILAALAASAVLASAASASPTWHVGSETLTGSETISGSATASTLALPGLTNTCDISYKATISNSGGTATGNVTAMTLSNCSTDGVCTIVSATAQSLPTIRGATVAGANYLVLEGVKIGILYGNPECVEDGNTVVYKGSAGALFANASSTFTFSPANSEATGAKMTALGTTVKWNGTFSTEATGANKGKALTLS